MKTLSPELVAELDCAGNQPVLVEHPRTHRVYVLVAADEMPLPSRSPSLSPNASWTEAMNARRFVLIDKQIEGTLSTAEAAELDGLQHDADAYLERVAPLPIAAMHDLHAR